MLRARFVVSLLLLLPFPILVRLDAAREGPQRSILTFCALACFLCGIYQLGLLGIEAKKNVSKRTRRLVSIPVVLLWIAGLLLALFFLLIYLFGGTPDPIYAPGFMLFGLLTIDTWLMVRAANR